MKDEREKKEGKEEEKEVVEEEQGIVVAGRLDIDKILTPEGKKFIREEGIMPFNPVEMAGDEDTSIKLGMKAGEIYGGSMYAIVSAALRDDLPINKRVKRAMLGARPLISMFFGAADVYKRFQEIEDSVLLEQMGVKGGVKQFGNKGRPDANDVISELKARLNTLEEENKELKKRVKPK